MVSFPGASTTRLFHVHNAYLRVCDDSLQVAGCTSCINHKTGIPLFSSHKKGSAAEQLNTE